MLKNLIGLSLVASSLLAIDQESVVEQLSCKTFTTNDQLAGIYKYVDASAKDWALYMPETDYLLMHQTGKSTVAEGAIMIPTSDFISISSVSPYVFGEYTGDKTRANVLSNTTMKIDDTMAGIYNQFDTQNKLWFFYMPQENYLLVHETGKTKIEDGALVMDMNTYFDNVEVDATSGSVKFIAKGGCGTLQTETLPNSIANDMTLTKDTLWLMDGLVVVESGATLTIEPGTTIAGYDGTASQTSYMVVDAGAKIIADGTAAEPITFTSTKVAIDGAEPAVGQWGGLTIIGNAGNAQVKPYEVNDAFVAGDTDPADNSGILRHVKILNSGITMDVDKEINGLSMVGVGSGTVVEDIRVDLSDDDGIELWGGTVNLTNVTITRCTDDYFDIDDGFSGTVRNLNITTTTGNAAIEMSGATHATFDGFNIVQNGSAKEGGIYFKKDGIGGHFLNGTITDNVDDAYGAIYSKSADGVSDTVDAANTSFENVEIYGTSTGARFTGTSATTLENKFTTGTGNSY
jgi:hypothetical protein